MRKLMIGVAAMAIVALATAVAFANPASDSTLALTAKPSATKAGTTKKPKGVGLNLVFKGGTKSGTGQPSSTTTIKVGLPKGWKYNGKKWPKKDRCDPAKVETAKSVSACPSKAKVGKANSVAVGNNGGITQPLTVDTFIQTSGNLGFFVQGTTPVAVEAVLTGSVSGRNITIPIASNLQNVAGIPVGITNLTANIKGKDGDVNLLETTACSKKWTFTGGFVYTDGSNNVSTDVACKKG